MYVLLLGLNHKTAPVEVRERLAINTGVLENAYKYFRGLEDIEGVVILATCNRTEVYATSRNIEKGMQALYDFAVHYAKIDETTIKQYMYSPNCYDAIMHLFRVASGLDSMILGESQIMAQVKEAYRSATEAGASDAVLNALFQKAINVGKRVRTETEIDKHPISVSSAAVELAREQLGSLEDKSVVVVGAGEMSELTTRYLMQYGLKSVIVSNRSYDKAVTMAENFGGRAVRFDELPEQLYVADIVISCTAASHYVLIPENCGEILRSRQGRRIVMIDIAVPRDIAPSLRDIPGVQIYDIDGLQNVIDANFMERKKAARKAEPIIVEEINKFNEWLAGLYVVPVISALKIKGEMVKTKELNRVFNRLEVNDYQRKVITTMANNIVNQLMHHPVVSLKEMACSNEGHLYAEVAKKLFNVQLDMEDNSFEELKDRHQRQ